MRSMRRKLLQQFRILVETEVKVNFAAGNYPEISANREGK